MGIGSLSLPLLVTVVGVVDDAGGGADDEEGVACETAVIAAALVAICAILEACLRLSVETDGECS